MEANGVIIDLNGHTIEQSKAHSLIQRFYSHIELSASPFPGSKGPSDFGPEPFTADQIWIKGPGKLGRSSHHSVHGNGNDDVLITDVDMFDFEVSGIHLNSVTKLSIKGCTVGPSRTDVPVKASYSGAMNLIRAVHTISKRHCKSICGTRNGCAVEQHGAETECRTDILDATACHQYQVMTRKYRAPATTHTEFCNGRHTAVHDHGSYGFQTFLAQPYKKLLDEAVSATNQLLKGDTITGMFASENNGLPDGSLIAGILIHPKLNIAKFNMHGSTGGDCKAWFDGLSDAASSTELVCFGPAVANKYLGGHPDGDSSNYKTRAAAEDACIAYGSACGGILTGGGSHWEVRKSSTPVGNTHETSFVKLSGRQCPYDSKVYNKKDSEGKCNAALSIGIIDTVIKDLTLNGAELHVLNSIEVPSSSKRSVSYAGAHVRDNFGFVLDIDSVKQLPWKFNTECTTGSSACTTKIPLRYCKHRLRVDRSLTSWLAAKNACLEQPDKCYGVYDPRCDGRGQMYLCDASQIKSESNLVKSSSSCVFEQPTLPESGAGGRTQNTQRYPSSASQASQTHMIMMFPLFSKWHKIWIGDVFCYRISAPWVPGVPNKTRLDSKKQEV